MEELQAFDIDQQFENQFCMDIKYSDGSTGRFVLDTASIKRAKDFRGNIKLYDTGLNKDGIPVLLDQVGSNEELDVYLYKNNGQTTPETFFSGTVKFLAEHSKKYMKSGAVLLTLKFDIVVEAGE